MCVQWLHFVVKWLACLCVAKLVHDDATEVHQLKKFVCAIHQTPVHQLPQERDRIYQHRSPNFPEVYQSYPHSLCNGGLLPITNTLHHDNLVMKLHNGGKHESWVVNLHHSQAFLSSSFMAVGHGSIFSSGGQQAESACSVAVCDIPA